MEKWQILLHLAPQWLLGLAVVHQSHFVEGV